MGNRYRRPETARLELTDGDWLIVRKHLTAGEEREAQARLIKPETFKAGGDRPLIDPEAIGIAQACAYLLDWSITDANDVPIVIRDQPYDFVRAALEGQTTESLKEILAAIDAHDTASAAARADQKKLRDGAIAPSPISTSVG